MADVDMSNDDVIKISGDTYTKSEARVLVDIINNWLNKEDAQQSAHRMSLCSCKETPIFDEGRLNKCLKCGLPLHR